MSRRSSDQASARRAAPAGPTRPSHIGEVRLDSAEPAAIGSSVEPCYAKLRMAGLLARAEAPGIMSKKLRSPGTDSTTVSWILLADGRRARILRCGRTQRGALSLQPVEEIEDEWDQDLHRRQASRSGPMGISFENIGHVSEERVRRFSRRILAWARERMNKEGVRRLDLFAPARMFGVLRSALPVRDRARIFLHEGDLCHATRSELSRHPALAEVAARIGGGA